MRMQRMFRIADLLPERESEAVTYKRLAELTGLSARELRRAIRRERREGEPILSSSRGVWKWNGADAAVLANCCARLARTGTDLIETARLMEQGVQD